MKRKRIIIGILAAGLAFTAALGTLGYGRILSSAHNFQHNYRAIENTSASLGLVERLVYSLVLANPERPKP